MRLPDIHKSKARETVLTMLVGLLAFGLLYDQKGFYIAAFVLGLASVFSQFLAEKIQQVWMMLGYALGFINSRILLSVIFFLFLTPIALLYRLFNKDALMLSKKGLNSYFHERNHRYQPKDFDKAW